ncbi:MAG: DUF5677 domain-containing protein [Synechococcus sp.]
MGIWDEYVAIRNSRFQALQFFDQRSKFILVLYARINSLSEGILILLSSGNSASPPALMRSALESYIDLRCLVKDENYIDCMHALQASSDFRRRKNNSSDNPYCSPLDAPVLASELDELKAKTSKQLTIRQRFEKAECRDLYYTVYKHLCLHCHGNLTSLASKNFEKGKIVVNSRPSKVDLLVMFSATINLALDSSIEVF